MKHNLYKTNDNKIYDNDKLLMTLFNKEDADYYLNLWQEYYKLLIHLFNLDTKEEFIGLPDEFMKQTGVKSPSLRSVLVKNAYTCSNWTLFENRNKFIMKQKRWKMTKGELN